MTSLTYRTRPALTPLVNVSLLILLALLFLAPQMGWLAPDVSLPASSGPDTGDRSRVEITVAADGSLQLAGDPVPLSALSARVEKALAAAPDAVVLIRGDSRLPYARVTDLMGRLTAVDAHRIALATRAPDGGGDR